MRKLLALLLLIGCLTAPEIAAERPGPKIVVARLDADQVAQLRKAVPKARIVAVEGRDDALKHIENADALIGVLDADLVKAGKKLRWVHVHSAGVDRYRFPELVQSDIVLTNAKIIQGPNVSDQALALLLAVTRRIDIALRSQQDKAWNRAPYREDGTRPVELEGKRALVVGLGGIGTAIARRVHGFGMTVVGVDPKTDMERPAFVEAVVPPAELHAQLPKTDVLLLAVPLTPKTEKMIGERELSLLKKGAFVVNIARGKVIDTDALTKSLQSGHLAGAGLDVTDPEPLPADHPLWLAPNVVITPHVGGTSDRVWERRFALAKDNLQRFVAGEELRNVVDKKAGY